MSFKVTGTDAILRKVTGMQKEAEMKVAEAVKTNILKMEAQAKSLAPVDTGNLRNSIQSSFTGTSGQLTVGAEYAMYVEMGTSKMAPQPFFFLAFERQKQQLTADITKALGG